MVVVVQQRIRELRRTEYILLSSAADLYPSLQRLLHLTRPEREESLGGST